MELFEGMFKYYCEADLSDVEPGSFISVVDMSGLCYVDANEPLDPALVAAARWDNKRAVCTIEMQDGTIYSYTKEAAQAACTPEQWTKEFEHKIVSDRSENDPLNFLHMYNYIKFGILPGDVVDDDDPHAGMVQGYNGEWRWI